MLGFVEALGEEDVDDEDAAEDEAEEAAGGGHQQQDPLLQLHTASQSISDVNKVLRTQESEEFHISKRRSQH